MDRLTQAEAISSTNPQVGKPVRENVERHFAHRGHGAEFEMESRWVARRIPESSRRILDIGCGNGALLPTLGQRRVIGLDFLHAGLRQTLKSFPGSRLACGDAATLPFADESFDAITAQHLIEHLRSPVIALREWRRVLRRGGSLLIITPNARFKDPSVYSDPTHVHIFDANGLAHVVEQSGLIVESVHSIGLAWFRDYHRIPGGWRVRQAILNRAELLSHGPFLRQQGQSLCCEARRPTSA